MLEGYCYHCRIEGCESKPCYWLQEKPGIDHSKETGHAVFRTLRENCEIHKAMINK